jgi:four helix bundle protein
MKEKGLLELKSFEFALQSIKVYQHLVNDKKEFVLARQLLKSATSIGANVKEATGAQSRADFIAKLSIAHKEALETEYWICLLRDSGILSANTAQELLNKEEVIAKILARSLLTAKDQKT